MHTVESHPFISSHHGKRASCPQILCLCRTASLFQQMQRCTGLSRSSRSAAFPVLLPHLSSTCPALILNLHFTSALVFHPIVLVSPLHLESFSRVSLSWKCLVLFKKLMFLFRKDALNWSKVTIKTNIMLQKISISNKCCCFELSIHQRITENKMYRFPQNIGQHNCFQHW